MVGVKRCTVVALMSAGSLRIVSALTRAMLTAAESPSTTDVPLLVSLFVRLCVFPMSFALTHSSLLSDEDSLSVCLSVFLSACLYV